MFFFKVKSLLGYNLPAILGSMKKYHSRHNIALLWSAQLVSGMGDAIYQIALMWLVLDLTGSPAIAGLVAMSAYLPAMIFGLYAGVLSDRHSRMRLMILSNISQSLTVALIPVLLFWGVWDVKIIGLLAFIRASFGTLFPPAFNSFIPTIVAEKELIKVNSMLSISGQMAYFFGPALAGILLGLINLNYLFVFDALSFLIGIVFLLMVVKPVAENSAEELHHPWTELKSGLKYVYTHHSLGFLIFLTTVNNLFIMGPAIVGTPILVKQALGGTVTEYAFIEAGLALGMLIGSVFVFRMGNSFKNGRILALGMVIDGLTYSIFYFADSVQTVFILIMIHGIGIPMITIPRTAIIQKYSPNKFHGRLFSMVHLAVVGMTAISSAFVGIIAEFVDIRIIFLFIGIIAAVCGIIGFLSSRIQALE